MTTPADEEMPLGLYLTYLALLVDAIQMMRTCRSCGKTKPLSEFHRAPGGRQGRKNTCRACCAVRDADPAVLQRRRERAAERRRASRTPEQARALEQQRANARLRDADPKAYAEVVNRDRYLTRREQGPDPDAYVDRDVRTKVCPRCGVAKKLAEFYINRARRDGHQPNCKACQSITSAADFQKHKDERLAKHAAWRAANPEKVRGYWQRQEQNRKRSR